MFTLQHFLWLIISACIILALLYCTGRFHWSYLTNLTILTAVCIASEILKTAVNMIEVPGFTGRYLKYEALPFHLCSLQIFFVFYLRFFCKKEETRQKVLGFIFPTMLGGGIMAMLIPTCGVSFLKAQVYQYYGFHLSIVWFAIYLVRFGILRIDFKTILRNYVYLFCIMFIVLWINSFLQVYGANFLYLSRPPMQNLPILNLDHGWYCYFAVLTVTAMLLLFLIQLPFAIYQLHNKSSK